MGTDKWIEKYEEKTGEDFWEAWDINEFPLIYTFPDGSFFTYGIGTDTLSIGPTCGNFKECYKVAEKICRETGMLKVRTYTRRNVKAFLRRTKGTLAGTVTYYDGRPTEYVIEWEVYGNRQ